MASIKNMKKGVKKLTPFLVVKFNRNPSSACNKLLINQMYRL